VRRREKMKDMCVREREGRIEVECVVFNTTEFQTAMRWQPCEAYFFKN